MTHNNAAEEKRPYYSKRSTSIASSLYLSFAALFTSYQFMIINPLCWSHFNPIDKKNKHPTFFWCESYISSLSDISLAIPSPSFLFFYIGHKVDKIRNCWAVVKGKRKDSLLQMSWERGTPKNNNNNMKKSRRKNRVESSVRLNTNISKQCELARTTAKVKQVHALYLYFPCSFFCQLLLPTVYKAFHHGWKLLCTR